jgi:DNA ligase D-like protein (predicted 3'-phosphoesterase)
MASLDAYQNKRDVRSTPEPSDDDGNERRFVIQKHDASTLHYDVRLVIGDALVSWSVPKGPSTDPSEKRLAQRTEDHPLRYADFEGAIPEGQYGAGTVLVWDRGPYRNLRAEKDGASIRDSLDDGKVEVWLDGEKLQGGYALIRIDDVDDRWLLIKMDDEAADARRNPTSTEPKSVLSGRTLDEIADDEAADDQSPQ